MGLPVFIIVVVTVANIALAALVFLHDPKDPVHRLFALVALAATGWTGTNALFQFTDSAAVAMLTAELSSAASILMSASFLHFSWVYPLRTSANAVRPYLLWTTALLLGLLSLWPGAVDRAVELGGTHQISTAPGFYLVALFLFVTTLAAFSHLPPLRHRAPVRWRAPVQRGTVL